MGVDDIGAVSPFLQALGGGTLPVDEVVDLGQQLAFGLGHLHSVQILCGSVSPTGVFRGYDGLFKLGSQGFTRVHKGPQGLKNVQCPGYCWGAEICKLVYARIQFHIICSYASNIDVVHGWTDPGVLPCISAVPALVWLRTLPPSSNSYIYLEVVCG